MAVLRLGVGAFVAAGLAAAQTFEVATVKRVTDMPSGSAMRLNSCTGGPKTSDPGLYACRGLALETLVAIAYGALPSDISRPGWMESERYDIFAKPPAGAAVAQIPEMLQRLLEERFALEVRRESRTAAVYELRAPNGAAKLKPSPPPGEAEDPEAARARGKAAADQRRSWGPGVAAALFFDPRVSMAGLAEFLSKMLDRPVVDQTGLTGTYSVELLFARDATPSTAADGPHAPTAFEALDEIGRKLERGKGAGERLVIVQAQKEPRAN